MRLFLICVTDQANWIKNSLLMCGCQHINNWLQKFRWFTKTLFSAVARTRACFHPVTGSTRMGQGCSPQEQYATTKQETHGATHKTVGYTTITIRQLQSGIKARREQWIVFLGANRISTVSRRCWCCSCLVPFCLQDQGETRQRRDFWGLEVAVFGFKLLMIWCVFVWLYVFLSWFFCLCVPED